MALEMKCVMTKQVQEVMDPYLPRLPVLEVLEGRTGAWELDNPKRGEGEQERDVL